MTEQTPDYQRMQPQWSPSAGDGTTSGARSCAGRTGRRNGARPLGTGRPSLARELGMQEYAAMEPVRWGRDDISGSTVIVRGPHGRNGARPLGTGRRLTLRALEMTTNPPQWSPSAGDGTTTALMTMLKAAWAAMEPVRWGRDDRRGPGQPTATGWPQWSPSAGDGTTHQAGR